MKMILCHNFSSRAPAEEKQRKGGTGNSFYLFVDALGKHPLCHRMCKVTKETSGANNILRNAIDSTSITFRWTSSSSRQPVFSTTTIVKKTEENGSQSRKSDYSPLWKRVIAWERRRAASGYGIIWGDADRNLQGGI